MTHSVLFLIKNANEKSVLFKKKSIESVQLMSSASIWDFPQSKVIIFLYSLPDDFSSFWSLVADKNEKSININEKFILTRQTAQKVFYLTFSGQDHHLYKSRNSGGY